VETIIETGGELLDPKRSGARRGELDRERMPSSRRQIAAVAAATRRSGEKCGCAARTRATNS